MSTPKLHLILVNDSQLHDGTIDILNEHFHPDLGINCGFIQSFNFSGDPVKLKTATQQCFALLREARMWAFLEEVVEVGIGKQNNSGINLFASLKKILLDVEFEEDTTLLIHGSLADLTLALSVLTDSKLKNNYQIELSNFSAVHSHNNVTSFKPLQTPQVNKNYSLV
jgi:hypothetical protein